MAKPKIRKPMPARVANANPDKSDTVNPAANKMTGTQATNALKKKRGLAGYLNKSKLVQTS